MFVAVARMPPGTGALARAAALAGLALPDAARALAGPLPRILVRATEPEVRLVERLEAEGFTAFPGTAAEVVSDAQRMIARELELSAEGLTAIDAAGRREACPWGEIHTILRGIRLVESTEVTKSTQRKLALGKALLTGGLSVTRKVETTSERTTTAKEGFLLLQRDGRPEIVLGEWRLDYHGLGGGIQPSTHGNLMVLLERLRAAAPRAAVDDRILRPGFLTGLPALGLDPVDLAVFLVTRARERGC